MFLFIVINRTSKDEIKKYFKIEQLDEIENNKAFLKQNMKYLKNNVLSTENRIKSILSKRIDSIDDDYFEKMSGVMMLHCCDELLKCKISIEAGVYN